MFVLMCMCWWLCWFVSGCVDLLTYRCVSTLMCWWHYVDVVVCWYVDVVLMYWRADVDVRNCWCVDDICSCSCCGVWMCWYWCLLVRWCTCSLPTTCTFAKLQIREDHKYRWDRMVRQDSILLANSFHFYALLNGHQTEHKNNDTGEADVDDTFNARENLCSFFELQCDRNCTVAYNGCWSSFWMWFECTGKNFIKVRKQTICKIAIPRAVTWFHVESITPVCDVAIPSRHCRCARLFATSTLLECQWEFSRDPFDDRLIGGFFFCSGRKLPNRQRLRIGFDHKIVFLSVYQFLLFLLLHCVF
jgi:hypothetical protein